MKKFIDQIEIDTTYDAGIVIKHEDGYGIGHEAYGAERTFSVGQPVYDKDGNLLGYLGIGLYANLDYAVGIRVPVEYWKICLPTQDCKEGKKVYTYWQMLENQGDKG